MLQINGASAAVPTIAGIRLEFVLFALTLLGVAIFHRRTMHVALAGLSAILLFKLSFDPSFHLFEHIVGSELEEGEWRVLLNLLGLLLGFAVLAKHFEESRLPEVLPRFLPDDWKGGLVLLVMVFVLSSFLDNIAAAIIGGTVAGVVFRGRLHIGYIAAVIAASNAGGSGSVVGDTTTTMMWIDGVAARDVAHGYVAAVPALLVCGIVAAFQQDRLQRITRDAPAGVEIEWRRIVVVALILTGTIATNILFDFPALGVWLGILAGAFFTRTPWREVPRSIRGTVFLLSLVMCASMMPVNELPSASWVTAMGLGFVSAVFDNIPLTKLALEQGGYDWGVLAYAVGFGGSMIWFGSSAGVAMSNLYPQAKNTAAYLRDGWHVALAYVVGFFIMLGVVGWHPHPARVGGQDPPGVELEQAP
ncbi:MAG: citrate transporter [Gemmatimonadetes bacterium]|nr:citrate transporter [Gemmatimonadota bacterium]